MADRVGQQLGNYRLIRLLGQGGFAEVYLGEHVHLATQAAIKVLHTRLTDDDLEGFRNEARIIARQVHPNIVRVLEFGVEAGVPFLVMDYAPNGTLRQRHRKGTRLAQDLVLLYIKQIAAGLQYAHDQKLIHRDIKPENMLLGRTNEVLLSDFGIALIAQSSRSQSVQEVAGTVTYMAPEQIQGKPRLASDQYALGVVVYEWLSGDRPFHGSFTEVAIQHALTAPPPLREKVPTISPDIEAVVLRALAKDPYQRFPNIQDFAVAFEHASRATPSPQPTFLASPPPVVISQPTITPTPPGSPTLISPPSTQHSTFTQQPTAMTPPQSAFASSPPPTSSPVGQGTTFSTPRNYSPGLKEVSQPKKIPRAAFIVGTLVLLVVLVIGSIFFATNGSLSFFAHSNTSNGPGNSGNSSTGNSAPVNGKGCTRVGILLPDTAIEARWEAQDHPLLVQDISAALGPGGHVDWNNAQGSDATQLTQAEADLAKGDCILVVAAHDIAAAASIVAKAKALNVPVIAYDRPIESKDLAYYVSFDNVMVGELQGQYIVDHYQSLVSVNGNNNVVMINGSRTDNSAVLFAQGAHLKLDPSFSSGALKKIYEQFTPNWDNATALTEMEAALTANNNHIAIAYVANDGMANSVIAALKAQKLNGKVLVTGQDATVAGIQNILTGDQSMTVYKSIVKEAQATANLIKLIVAGSSTASLTNGATTMTAGGTPIPSVLEVPVAVDKTNIATTVIADGYVSKADVCVGIPAGTDGVC